MIDEIFFLQDKIIPINDVFFISIVCRVGNREFDSALSQSFHLGFGLVGSEFIIKPCFPICIHIIRNKGQYNLPFPKYKRDHRIPFEPEIVLIPFGFPSKINKVKSEPFSWNRIWHTDGNLTKIPFDLRSNKW